MLHAGSEIFHDTKVGVGGGVICRRHDDVTCGKKFVNGPIVQCFTHAMPTNMYSEIYLPHIVAVMTIVPYALVINLQVHILV